MKNNILYVGVLILGLLLGYTARTFLDRTDGRIIHGGMMGMHFILQNSDDFDREFLREMILHHEGAIDMANAALKNTKRKEIRDLSNSIIDSQSKEIEQMEAWYKTWYK